MDSYKKPPVMQTSSTQAGGCNSLRFILTLVQAHPGVEVLVRDRAEAYAEAAGTRAPAACQVADRFHLLSNLADVLMDVFRAHAPQLALINAQHSPAPTPVHDPEDSASAPHLAAVPLAPPQPSTRAAALAAARRAQRVAQYEQVWTYHRQGWTLDTIAHQVGLSRRTVQRYLQSPTLRHAAARATPEGPGGGAPRGGLGTCLSMAAMRQRLGVPTTGREPRWKSPWQGATPVSPKLAKGPFYSVKFGSVSGMWRIECLSTSVNAGDDHDGATIHLRAGGQGPAVVLLHGFGDTGDMWAPLAAALARDHTVVVPDLRGMGLSSHPADGYDKRTQAADVRAVLTHLGLDRVVIVGHDIGTMVSYAYAARYPDQTEKLVVMDAPVPGIPPGTTSCATPVRPTSSRKTSPYARGNQDRIPTGVSSSVSETSHAGGAMSGDRREMATTRRACGATCVSGGGSMNATATLGTPATGSLGLMYLLGIRG